MQKVIAVLLCLLLLCGCTSARQADSSVSSLILGTSLPEKDILPLVREFENRTGIYVTIRTETARRVIDMASNGECDVVLGLGADTLEADRELFRPLRQDVKLASWVPTGSNWVSIFATRPIIIYNRNLVQNNPPEDFESLLNPMWHGQLALADPESCDYSAITLSILSGENQSETEARLRQLVRNIGMFLPQTRDAVDEVIKGNACLALVSSQMLAETPSVSVGRIYPQADLVFSQAAAITLAGKNEAQARIFLDFLMEEPVQQYIARELDVVSVLQSISEETPVTAFNSRRAGQNFWAVLDTWHTVREG